MTYNYKDVQVAICMGDNPYDWHVAVLSRPLSKCYQVRTIAYSPGYTEERIIEDIKETIEKEVIDESRHDATL